MLTRPQKSIDFRPRCLPKKCNQLISIPKEATATNNEPWLHRLSRPYWLMRNDTTFFNSESRISYYPFYDHSVMMVYIFLLKFTEKEGYRWFLLDSQFPAWRWPDADWSRAIIGYDTYLFGTNLIGCRTGRLVIAQTCCSNLHRHDGLLPVWR